MSRNAMLWAVLCLSFAGASLYAGDRPDFCLPVIDEVHESFPSLEVEGFALSDGSIHVSIAELDGTIVFESRFPVMKEDGRYLEWEYRGETPYSMSRRVDDNTVRTLAGMTAAAKDIVRAIKRGTVANRRPWDVSSDDDWGCDWPFSDLSCTPAGNCCDTHDACYAAFNCTALSWAGLESSLCTACNAVLLACIANGTGGTGLPSECCWMGNCGQNRQGEFFGYLDPGDGNLLEQVEPSPGGGGGGGWFTIITTPWGSFGFGGGTCRFPNGVTIPCG